MKTVKVLWTDAFSGTGWISKADLDNEIKSDMAVTSVGMLYYEDKDRVVLIQSINDTEPDGSYVDNYLVIPQHWITEITEC